MKQNFLKSFLFCLFIFASTAIFAYDCKVNGIFYNLNKTDNTAIVTYELNTYNNYSGVVQIPENIEHESVIYTVVSIGHNAFRNCIELSEVIIPNSVTSISNSAFFGCSGLTKMNILNVVPFIGSDAFSGCNILTSIVSWCTTPQKNLVSTFDETIDQTAILYVLKGCKKKYEAAEYWKSFLNIQEIQQNGIEPLVIGSPKKIDNYNFSGQKATNLMKGGILQC